MPTRRVGRRRGTLGRAERGRTLTCALTVGVIITSVQPATEGAVVTHAPIVGGAWYEVGVAAMLVGVAEKTIRNDLSEFKARFDCARYRPSSGRRWGKRLISARDVDTLRAMYPIRDTWLVKPKVIIPTASP